MQSRLKCWHSCILCLVLLANCATSEGNASQLDPSGLLREATLDVLFAMDELEDGDDPAAAPYLLGIMRDKNRDLALRSRSAAALMALGFPQGQDFCIAVLRAGLRGQEAESKRHAIPRLERYAFARELALRQVKRRLNKAGKKLPFYDVNQGSKDMLLSCEIIERELLALKTLEPAIRRAALAKRIPLKTPSGFEAFDWAALRDACLSVCASN